MSSPSVRAADPAELRSKAKELFPFRECDECGEFLGTSRDPCPVCGSEKDVPSFREYQGEALMEAAEALYVQGYKNVILDLPTGIGKSPLNVTLALLANHFFEDKAFYTTPQKSLRDQLANDESLNEHIQMLKARSDYTCGETGKQSDGCPIYNRSDMSCRAMSECTYWGEKEKAMRSPIAAITFAMLVVDNYVPTVVETKDGYEQVSFDDRGMLIVDEVHGLEGQVSGLFAGFTASPHKLPEEVIEPVLGQLQELDDVDGRIGYEKASELLDRISVLCGRFMDEYAGREEYQSLVDACRDYRRKHEYAKKDVEERDRPWVVNVEDTQLSEYDDKDWKKVKVKPVDVDKFLQEMVWSRGEKRVLSSATVPYPGKRDEWCERIGLDPDRTEVISKAMPFPEENRRVFTHTEVGKMSNGGDEENWDRIVAQIEDIWSHHEGEKGLIHTASYARAKQLAEDLGEERVYLHDGDEETSAEIERWQRSNKDVMVSPSMMEGVDLYDDRCRWQVLVKVPYRQTGDSRVDYLLNKRKDWEWYFQEAYMDVLQSVGRGVRSSDDWAYYYVLDESFKDVMGRVQPPYWFMEAIRTRAPDGYEGSGQPA